MKLTHQNYHTLENRYLTGSRMGDFTKCKRYFQERHILGTKTSPGTPALITGSAVDLWLSEGKDAFMSKFVAVARRNIKNPPVGYAEITNGMFDEIVELCEVAEKQPAFQGLKDHKSQEIIKYDEDLGPHFCGVSFIPDWYLIDGDTCIITDLKTAQNAELVKYFYHCLTYRYFEQMAVATIIFRKINKDIKHFVYRHFVLEKDSNGVPVPYVYFLDNARVEACANVIENELIPEIASERDFNPKSVDWMGAETIGSLDNDWD